ncbi:MAG: hypothetical protein VKQ33_02135 [Candidatus Sericytochromatia bacterium]|nr:hypothetical protein [Candidatus Sericytochromatia bacterium]
MSDHEERQAPDAAAEAPDANAAPPAEAASSPEVASAASAPARPSIRGIHPELVCRCPECEDDNVELQWFNVDEARKTKGDAMLFCGRSSRKYFVPILDLNAWLSQHGGARRGRRGEA